MGGASGGRPGRGPGTWVSLLLALLAAATLVVGCADDPAPTPTPRAGVVVEWRREGDRWCEYYRIGDNLVPALRCAKQVATDPQPTFDIYVPRTAAEPTYRQAFPPGLEEYVFLYWFSSKSWTRQLASGAGAIDYCFVPTGSSNCEWVSAEVHARLLAEATRQGQVSEAAASRQRERAEAAAEAARQNSLRFQAEAAQRQLDLGRIWVAPDCVHSSNGCWP